MQTKGYSKQELLQCETFSILKKCANKIWLDVGFRPLLHSVVGLHDVAWCFRRPQGLISQGERAVEGIWNWHKETVDKLADK